MDSEVESVDGDELEEVSWEERRKLEKIIDSVEKPQSQKIELLQKTQNEYGWLKGEHMQYLAECIDTSYTDLYGIASFYSQFTLNPPGRHEISVCMGTSCHVKGADDIMEELQEFLNIGAGETTEDRRFSLNQVRCLGCCGLAPVVDIDGEIYSRVRPSELEEILEDYE